MATKQIQPASKKIKKAKTATNIHSKDTRLKKYKTLTKAAKSIIVQSLMSELSFPLNGEEFPRVRFLNHLKALDQNGKKSYNKSLEKALTAYVNSDVVSKQSLKQWRRKVKDWVQNYGKPETILFVVGGGALVPDDKLEWFKAKLIPILHNLPKKSFDLLRKHLLIVFEEMHLNSDKSDQPFNPKTCSKHFWYYFLQKNPDIEEIYEAIPHKINDPRLFISDTPIQSYPSQLSFAKNFERPSSFSDNDHKLVISSINPNISHEDSSTHLSSSCVQDQYLNSSSFDMNFEHNLNDFEQGSIHPTHYPKGTPTFLESPEEAQSLLLSNYQPIQHPNTDFLFPNKGVQSNPAHYPTQDVYYPKVTPTFLESPEEAQSLLLSNYQPIQNLNADFLFPNKGVQSSPVHLGKALAVSIDKIDHFIFQIGQNPSISLAGAEGGSQITKQQYHSHILPTDDQQNTLEMGLCRNRKSQPIIEPEPNVYQRQCFLELYQGNFNFNKLS